MDLPKMIKIRCRYDDECIADIGEAVRSEIARIGLRIRQGDSIAIAVGSRGIANVKDIVKETVAWGKEHGGNPFIVPAMGSHGGANAEGQQEVLASYGVTQEYVGAPVKSSMQTVEIDRGNLENRVFVDRFAYEADGIIVINRVKVHTDFHGAIESGIMKMCVIGLGKHLQALEIHRHGVYGLKELLPKTALHILRHTKIIMGLAIVENAYDKTMLIRAIKPEDFATEDSRLLEISRRNMPKLPTDRIDILLVDEMGKDISGAGLDTNIIGRLKIRDQPDAENPKIKNIIVMDLTQASHGNAIGMGLADYITKKLFEKIDFQATYENVITSTFTERGKMPIVADTDQQAVQYAVRTSGPVAPEDLRIIRIRNTLRLDEMAVSQSIWEEIRENPNIEKIEECAAWFDGSGRICAL